MAPSNGIEAVSQVSTHKKNKTQKQECNGLLSIPRPAWICILLEDYSLTEEDVQKCILETPQQIRLMQYGNAVWCSITFFLESFLSSCGMLSSLSCSSAPRTLFKGLKRQTCESAIWSFVLWTENTACCCCRNPSPAFFFFFVKQKWI